MVFDFDYMKEKISNITPKKKKKIEYLINIFSLSNENIQDAEYKQFLDYVKKYLEG